LFKSAKARRNDLISENVTIVCTCTGHGLKDPEIISAKFSQAAPIAATLGAVREAITRS
jgi:threonine synthase